MPGGQRIIWVKLVDHQRRRQHDGLRGHVSLLEQRPRLWIALEEYRVEPIGQRSSFGENTVDAFAQVHSVPSEVMSDAFVWACSYGLMPELRQG